MRKRSVGLISGASWRSDDGGDAVGRRTERHDTAGCGQPIRFPQGAWRG